MTIDAKAAQMPRRILMTADTVGGVWTYAVELSRELGRYGVAVALAIMGEPLSRAQLGDLRALPNVELFEGRFKLEWMDDPWDDVLRAGEWLLGIEAICRPDLIHLNGYSHSALPWAVPKLVVGHSCVFSWWSAVKKESPSFCDRYRDRVSKGLAAADMVIAPTKDMLGALNRHYGTIRNGRVIYNGRTLRIVEPAKGAEEKNEYILSVGRLWDEAKNMAALDRIACSLPWPVFAAGQNDCHMRTMEPENIYCLGVLSESRLSDWYSRASIFALPARYEPFGLSALEAGLSGCALVLGDITSLREVWGDAAIFVKPDETETLKNVLIYLIKDKKTRMEMGSRARARALEFSPARMASEYMKAYGELLSSRMCVQCT